jgi:septal ring factor EnvC (AmiA/AmiB activator)
VTKTSETQNQTEQPEAKAPPSQSSRKSILALSIFALGLNATAAAFTLSPSEFALPNISSLAELLPHQKASDSTPDPVVAALKDIQSAQQQHVASLTSLLQQDSITLASLRQSVTDEQVDVKKISGQISDEHEDVKKMSVQISKLMSKVDSLQIAITRDVTSSITTGQSRNRPSSVVRKRMARQPKPVGPVSVGGAPISFPATTPSPQG